MNNARRKRIEAIRARLDAVFEGELESIRSDLNDVKDEEESALEGLPENMRDGERGAAMQDAINALESAVDALEAFDFESIFSSLEDATQ